MWQEYVVESQQFYPISQINLRGSKYRCKFSPPLGLAYAQLDLL